MPRILAHFTWTMSAFCTSQTFCRLARRKVVQELQLELPSLDAEDQEPFDSDEDWDSLQFARVALESRRLWNNYTTKEMTAEICWKGLNSPNSLLSLRFPMQPTVGVSAWTLVSFCVASFFGCVRLLWPFFAFLSLHITSGMATLSCTLFLC